MIRVAIDAHMLGDHSGGNETHYTNLINHLKPTQDVEIILFIREEYEISNLKLKCKYARFRSENPLIRNFIEIPKLVKQYHIDVLHMQYFIPFIKVCPTIVIIHDISFEHYKNIFTKKDYMAQKVLIPYAAKHSDFILTDSEYSKADIIEHYKILSNKIFITYSSASDTYRRLNISEQEKTTFLCKMGIDTQYILCVGNLQPRKNIPNLLKAYGQFRQECKGDTKLVIVGGKAWLFDEIFKEMENTNLQEHVIFSGYLSEEELCKLYNLALFFVYPSFFEGFGLPVLEAMLCGTPVATSNVTSLPEVAGDAALLFDPFQIEDIRRKMKKLYDNSKLREELVKKGYEQAKKFNWDEISEKVMEQYIILGDKGK